MYGCVSLLFTLKYHTVANQLYPIQNKKLEKKKERERLIQDEDDPGSGSDKGMRWE